MARLEQRPWWPDLVRIKDDYSLRELADRFGVSPSAINVALKRAGLRRRSARPGRPTKGSGPSAARRAKARGRHARRYSELRLEPYLSDLGRYPDQVIADKAGLSSATVARIRRARDVPAYRFQSDSGRGRSRIARYTDLLGRLPDAEVARLAGVSRAAVRNFRVRRGIASPGHSPAEASSLRAKTGRENAWLIGLASEEDSVVVLAESLFAALSFAHQRGKTPVSVSLLAPLI